METQIQNNASLVQLLTHQEQLYARAMDLAASIKASSHQQTADLSLNTEQLNQVMAEIAATDVAIGRVRVQLEATGQLKSPEVRMLVAKQEETLRVLIGRIDASLGHVGQQHAELSESLDSGANRNNMQEAYRMSMRTG